MLANHPGGFLSLFSLHLSIPHPPPRSLLSFFLRCMSAIHLSAVSASERYTELSLRISSGLGGLFCSCRSNTYFSWCSRGALLWKHKSTHTHTHTVTHTLTRAHRNTNMKTMMLGRQYLLFLKILRNTQYCGRCLEMFFESFLIPQIYGFIWIH